MAARFNAGGAVNAGHLGAFWSQVRDRFPTVHAAQPIASRAAAFDTEAQWTPPAIRFAVTDQPDCRLQMTAPDDETWMWQVQSDRLVVNWRKRSSQYPRYSEALREFGRAWRQWARFLAETGEAVEPVAWELTYVNEIPAGPDELWETVEQWPEMLPGLLGVPRRGAGGLTLAGLHGQWVWQHADPPAELIVSPAPATREQRHALILKLAARGPIDQENQPAEPMDPIDESYRSLEAGLNVGHRLIVSTFDAMVSDAAKQHWGRHDGD